MFLYDVEAKEKQQTESGSDVIKASTSSIKDITGSGERADGAVEFTFASESANGTRVKILRDDMFHDYDNRDRLLGRIEGIQLVSRRNGSELSQAECYRLCGIVHPEKSEGTAESGHESKSITPKKPAMVKMDNSSSPLSDCPSDLSDWATNNNKARHY
jgi:hypothetical protein